MPAKASEAVPAKGASAFDELVQKAKAEGQVKFADDFDTIHAPVFQAFEKQFGIKIVPDQTYGC